MKITIQVKKQPNIKPIIKDIRLNIYKINPGLTFERSDPGEI